MNAVTPTIGCETAPRVHERGQREVFCGLTGIVWLHRKIRDAFFLVVGSRTCAHLIQSAAGVMIFAEPRFATAILEERDLAGIADVNDELDRVVARLIERRPEIKLLFLVGSCPSEVIKIDLKRAAARQSGRHSPASEYSAIPAAASRRRSPKARTPVSPRWFRRCPPNQPLRSRASWWWARSPMSSRTNSRACSAKWAWALSASCRCARAPKRPRLALGPGSCSRSRSSATPPARSKRAAPSASRRRFRWARKAPPHGCAPRRTRSAPRAARFEAVTAPGRARARQAVARHRERLAGKSVFFFPDSQLEIPLARFLAAELGMDPIEVGTPYLHRGHLAQETRRAAAETRIVEGQDVERQLDRCRAARPDLTVCGLGLANPLEAEGLPTKWSIELLFTPIQGYEQAGDLAELFARPLNRRARLEV